MLLVIQVRTTQEAVQQLQQVRSDEAVSDDRADCTLAVVMVVMRVLLLQRARVDLFKRVVMLKRVMFKRVDVFKRVNMFKRVDMFK